PVGVERETGGDDPQALDAVAEHYRIGSEGGNDGRCEDDECKADGGEEDEIVEAGAPDGALRAIGIAGPEGLTDHRRRRVAHAPGGQQGEDYDADADGVASQGLG